MYEPPQVVASYNADQILAEAETSSGHVGRGHHDHDDDDNDWR